VTYRLKTPHKVALSDSNQRAVLIVGTELALYMGNRLTVYLDTYARLTPSIAATNFRRSLMDLYVHLLQFLGRAIRIQRKRSGMRAMQALWDSGDLMQFEEECDKLCLRASEEARICDSRACLEAQLRGLDEIHNAHASVVRVQVKVDLGKLETANEATYNSSAEGELSRCLPDTRTDLLEQIANWAVDHASKRIFWLCGKAGTGKSTISRTIAQKLDDDGLLGASFFFKRGRADRSHAKLLFPTIARQLADLFPDIAHAIAASLDQDSLLCDRYLITQFERLLLQPLQSVDTSSIPSAVVVLVIDALDECDNSESIRTSLLLLSRVEAITSFRLRIFVTSRPELPVELGFKDMSGDLHHDVQLEEAQETSIAHDIRVFYEHQFTEIKKHSLLHDDDLPAEWPGEHDTRTLVDQAVPLFIFAFTVSRYISANPKRNLATILRQRREKSLAGLKSTYLPILDQVVASEGDGEQKDRIHHFKRVVGSVVLLYDPLSASALVRLIGLQAGEIGRVLRPLHSVLNIPRASDGKMNRMMPITLFHLSFRDFLIDPKLKSENKFWISAEETHKTLGMHCIRMLESGCLKEDVCEVVAPGTRRADVAKSVVYASLPEPIAYACCYWVQHFVDSRKQIKDDGAVLRFLEKHLLHWMEALSWLGKASDVIHSLKALESIVDVSFSEVVQLHDLLTGHAQTNQGKRLLLVLDDASSFATRNRFIIDQAPLQIYMSALLFAPSLSNVRRMFSGTLQRYFEAMPHVPERWSAERQKLEGHDGGVLALVFSPSGEKVASGSWDGTIRLWDAITGEERQKLEGHDDAAMAVAFSPDGKTLASGSNDKTVRLWDLALGQQKQRLERHDDMVQSVAFSPDGKIVASGSNDKTIRLWDAATGKPRHRLVGHYDMVKAVGFSPDCTTVVSGSADNTARLWDAVTGEERQKLEGHDGIVATVAFSPDGKTIASGSWDNTVRLWDSATGEGRQKLEGHSHLVSGVAFSPDGKIVASGSADETIRLWDTATGKERQKLEIYSSVEAVAFSPDGKTVAAGSSDSTIRLWDIVTGEKRQGLIGHDGTVNVVAFSPDGKTVASGSIDKVVRLWDTATRDEKQKLEGHEDSISAVVFSSDSRTVISSANGKTLGVWDVESGEEKQKITDFRNWSNIVVLAQDCQTIAAVLDNRDIKLTDIATGGEKQRLEGHTDQINTVVFSPDGKTVASGSCDKTLRLWDVATGKEKQKFEGHDKYISAIAFSPDGNTVASGSGDKSVRLWDAAMGIQRQKLEGHYGLVEAVAFSPDGKIVASGSNDRTIRLWSVVNGEEIQELKGHNQKVRTMAFSSDGKMVASGSSDKTVRLWDIANGKEKQKLEGHDDVVTAVAFSPDSKTVASGSLNDTVRLWDAATGRNVQKLVGHVRGISAVAFSLDGKTVVSGSCDKTVRLWDVTTGEERQKLEGHDGYITALAFSPNGKTVASGSRDSTVMLWDALTGVGKQKLEGHNEVVTAVAFSLDSKTVATGSGDYTVRLWDAATGDERQKHQTSKTVSRIACFDNDSRLETDIGQLDFSTTPAVHRASVTKPQPILLLESSWIRHCGADFLWLPYEYRGVCHDACGPLLVIGQASGAVSFFSFK
jgi:WD40 repeat protein